MLLAISRASGSLVQNVDFDNPAYSPDFDTVEQQMNTTFVAWTCVQGSRWLQVASALHWTVRCGQAVSVHLRGRADLTPEQRRVSLETVINSFATAAAEFMFMVLTSGLVAEALPAARLVYDAIESTTAAFTTDGHEAGDDMDSVSSESSSTPLSSVSSNFLI